MYQIDVQARLIISLQSLSGKNRGLQGNPSTENRAPAVRTGVPCNENRVFPVGIDSQGVPCEPYRVWVCNVDTTYLILFSLQNFSEHTYSNKHIYTMQLLSFFEIYISQSSSIADTPRLIQCSDG